MPLRKGTNKQPLSLDAIAKAAADLRRHLSEVSSPEYELEKAKLEVARLELENHKLGEGIKDQQKDRELREKYANWAFRFLVVFSVFSGLAIVAQGFSFISFKLPEKVLMTLIGATAASVIGLVGWIARGLFRAPSD